jgi:hypothetical protein
MVSEEGPLSERRPADNTNVNDDGDDDDHVSPSLEAVERTQPPSPWATGETEASLLPAFSPAVPLEDADGTITRPANSAVESASVVLVHETVRSSPKQEGLKAATETLPALLGGEASQELLLEPAAATTTEGGDEVARNASVDARHLEAEENDALVAVTDDGDGVDVVREAAIHDKYGATSKWVENLPFAVTAALNDDGVVMAVDGAPEATAPARRGKRPRGAKDDTQNVSDSTTVSGTLRQRRARKKAAAAEVQTAFKHSQRALRKQAKSVNMRDVFSRSLALPSSLNVSEVHANTASPLPSSPLFVDSASSDNGGGRAANRNIFSTSLSSFRFGMPVFSPSGALSPTTPSGSSSGWSPCVVGELTNQFLASVKHQRRQKCEQFVSRELSQSQTRSQTRTLCAHSHGGSDVDDDLVHQRGTGRDATHPHSSFAAPIDELVIGDDDNEAANWMPTDACSPASSHGRRMMRDLNANDDVVLLGGSSAGDEGGQHTTSPSTLDPDNRTQEDLALRQHQQQQVVQSLSRKHEIWKLKQRQLKSQQQVDLDQRAKAKQQQQQQQPSLNVSATTSSLTTITTSTDPARVAGADAAGEGVGSAATVGATTTHQNFFHTSQVASPTTNVPRILHKTNLSADAISMIRRINSFDNTSTQRVVVFDTAASAKHTKENTQ